MSHADDPRCPECGGPIGQTATYCMHCSADLTEELEAADADDDGAWDRDRAGTASATGGSVGSEPGAGAGVGLDAGSGAGVDGPFSGGADGQVLDPDGLVDNTLTVLVGIGGGIVVGIVGTVVLLAVTGSGWALAFGFVAWLGSTAYLVRRRTVQGAISKGAYAVAVVLLLVPVVALSPAVSVDGGIGERGSLFVVLLVFAALPAGVAAAVGWVASQFVPAEGGSEG